nr:hypothetical protein CFP56_03372 [Quercus suber]
MVKPSVIRTVLVVTVLVTTVRCAGRGVNKQHCWRNSCVSRAAAAFGSSIGHERSVRTSHWWLTTPLEICSSRFGWLTSRPIDL